MPVPVAQASWASEDVSSAQSFDAEPAITQTRIKVHQAISTQVIFRQRGRRICLPPSRDPQDMHGPHMWSGPLGPRRTAAGYQNHTVRLWRWDSRTDTVGV